MLFKFEYNDILYYGTLENNEIKFHKVNNGIKSDNLTIEEISLIYEVLDAIMPSNDKVFLRNIKFNNNTYQMYYDKKTGLRLFEPINNYLDFARLNYMFNNMKPYLYSEISIDQGKYSRPNDRLATNDLYIDRIAYIKRCFIAITVSALMVTSTVLTLVNKDYANKVENVNIVSTMDDISQGIVMFNRNLVPDEVFTSRLSESINQNPNLNEKEKEVFLSCIPSLLDNKSYYDLNHISNVFKKVVVIYQNSPNEETPSVVSYYNRVDNTITCFNCTSIEDVTISDLLHEIGHLFTVYKPRNLNIFLLETSNVLYNKEYLSNDRCYSLSIPYARALIEIIGAEPLKIYHGIADIGPTVDALCKIIDDEDKAYKFLADLNDYINESLHYETMKYMDSLGEELSKELSEYYYAKYGRKMDNDLIMMYNLNDDRFQEMIREGHYPLNDSQYHTFTIIKEKSYFNSSLKGENNDFVFLYEVYERGAEANTDQLVYSETITINDSNRYLDNDMEVKM